MIFHLSSVKPKSNNTFVHRNNVECGKNYVSINEIFILYMAENNEFMLGKIVVQFKTVYFIILPAYDEYPYLFIY